MMKTGKASETVLKRSILKQLHTKRSEILMGPNVGEDCSALVLEPNEIFVLSTDPVIGTHKGMGRFAVHAVVNNLASSGAEPVGILMTILLPEQTEEGLLRQLVSEAEKVCQKLSIQILGGHTEITPVVNGPVLSVTGVGKVKKGCLVKTGGARAGDDIVATKWIGLEGTSMIAKEEERELQKRFNHIFLEEAQNFDKFLSVIPESLIATRIGVNAMHDARKGGIFGALWELAEASGVGLEVDLKKIPIRQETVEICEYFRLNPYRLISGGCMLITASDGRRLVEELEREDIHAVLIGRCVQERAKKIVNQGEISYLERP